MAHYRIAIVPRASRLAVRAAVRAPKAEQCFAIRPRPAQPFASANGLAKGPPPGKNFFSTFFKNPLARSREM